MGVAMEKKVEKKKAPVNNKGQIQKVFTKTLPSGWRVCNKKTINNIKFYLLVSCKYETNKETGEAILTKTPVKYNEKNIFRIAKESVSKFEKFNGHITTFPDIIRVHKDRVLKAVGLKATKYVTETTDYIHNLQDTGYGNTEDAKIFGNLEPVDFIDSNNNENKLRLFLGDIKNYTEKEDVN